ncbi:hypothetical protein BCR41DRAFT_370988 [Lobosporangium transversale]|uniref:Galactose oxidase n=1 Tax=Lobosporangium transversale TaxID=64571 RepID=A0A1Y2GM00_9FUNG|nr:hypothetical protein BCR41DRAFT_370988 [Lobosporangium transversale]ORZ14881.1 hypothetical protein BCR41DRAFT_370988 [Lobosporangium transversale]|eukprot:XP_021881013.1 hypothetical protein BCR41DRAFT_370988 [Lobosporangium transversale]
MSSTLPQHPTVPKGTDIPEPVGKMAYASDDSQLFIQGGSYGSENKISSAFSLNLTSDWSVEDPAWSRLELIENFYGQSGVMNLGRFIAFETGNNQINVSIYSKHWERLNLSPSFNTPDPVIVSRQDGMVYFLGKKGEALFMDTKNWTFSNFKSPTFDTFEPTGQSASWSAYKESILIPIFNDTDVDVHMYNTSSHISRPLNTAKNLKITPRTGYCFVPCNDGKQYYLFGGRNDTAVFDDLYLLDLEENTWTQLDNSRSSRSMMACAVREKTLVVWGGKST